MLAGPKQPRQGLAAALRNVDAADHLSCDKKGLWAYLAAVGAPVDLLFHAAWESSATLFEQCYQKGVYRWAYRTGYLNEADWHLIGLAASRPGYRLDADEFKRLALPELDQGFPVFFDAPKAGIGYFLDLMKKHATPTVEYDETHFYMAVDFEPEADNFVFFDIFHAQGLLGRSAFGPLRAAYAQRPEAWFNEAYALRCQCSPVKQAEIAERHRQAIAGMEADISIYEHMFNMIDYELTQRRLTYMYGSVNALSLLHGSRSCFARYVLAAGHPPAVQDACLALSQHLARLQVKLNQLFTRAEAGNVGAAAELAPALKQGILRAGTLELAAVAALKRWAQAA